MITLNRLIIRPYIIYWLMGVYILQIKNEFEEGIVKLINLLSTQYIKYTKYKLSIE